MEKTLALILAILLSFGLAIGCASPSEDANANPTAAPAAEPTEAPVVETPTEEPEVEPTEEPLPETRLFTDSIGREVEIPYTLDQIAISGPLAQIVVFALAPDKLVGIANEWDESAMEYFDEKYYNLPLLGQLYGGKGELNLEVLLSSGAQVVIDVGEPKDGMVEELNALQEQTGLPFVHITMTTETAGDAYRKLGELLGMENEAETLAVYCETVYNRTLEIANSVEKKSAVYCLGDAGLNVIAQTSYHGEIIDLLTENLAVVEDVSSRGTGNEVNMEQLLLWDPEVILFAPDSIYDTVADEAAWQSLQAIQNGTYYKVPFGPYNWMGFPPSVQRYLGMMWLCQLLYPEEAQYDLVSEVQEYFELFYHCEISAEQVEVLLAGSIN
ncbi:MAG: ABC transporter substrate-binding protein [Clostridia bacterium]|nr:ABC transporter substrate-binding protein [Clostridia bacterium]